MKRTLAVVILLASAVSAPAITIETVHVGDVGNPTDPVTDVLGSVNYDYYIGKYEVTLGQYTAFLNATAKSDTYNVYHSSMATNLQIAGIARGGSFGSYTYSVIGSPNRPVTYVTWIDAARFVNWLHNGQPTGSQNNATTEDGVYTLNGEINGIGSDSITRNTGAKWFIPTENEWYKAAYYQPAGELGGDDDSYWSYPMKTNSVPYSDQPPGLTPDNTRVGNFYKNDGVANNYDDGYAVTGSDLFTTSQNYLTNVGAYTSSPSYYGTFDQGGNVQEWTETVLPTMVGNPGRGVRGGAWDQSFEFMRSTDGIAQPPGSEVRHRGFRVASIIPEPSSALLAVSIFALLASRRSRR
jgi:formylglycine-generating enzyme required for sulfatase activity